MARYRVTFEIDAVDQNDAVHWAQFTASLFQERQDTDIVSVVRYVKIGDEGVATPVVRADARRGIRLGRPQQHLGP